MFTTSGISCSEIVSRANYIIYISAKKCKFKHTNLLDYQ